LRRGSKGIPGKNIMSMAGKPLCAWVVEAAAATSALEEVLVATDSPQIAETVQRLCLPKVRVIGRGVETATDTASTESVMLEVATQGEFSNLVLLQATSPLTTADDIDRAVEHFERTNADSLLSVAPQKRFLWSIDADERAAAINYDPARRPRRQDFSGDYVENGAIYISRRAGLLEARCRLFGRIAAFVMDDVTLHELDDPSDALIIEALLSGRSHQSSSELLARAAHVRLFIADVDGVMTDSGMYYSENGDELKKFNTRDGKAFELLKQSGILTGLITGEQTMLVSRRASKIKADFIVQGVSDKVPSLVDLMRRAQVSPEQVAYVGDDLADIPVLRMVGLSACPADAIGEVATAAMFHCRRRGGEGAVRELADFILHAQRVLTHAS
jgi:N-acylneuraminate cytidylyltransferase